MTKKRKRRKRSLEPEVKKYPTEYFGYAYTDKSDIAQKARVKQYCPFLNGECKKPRKSEPKIKVGVCSVGYKGSFLTKFVPIIICPYRFKVGHIFDTIEDNYFGDISSGYEIAWASEVSLGVGGSVDYVAVKKKKFGGLTSLEDFVCVEFQATGTTGTPWKAVEDYKRTGKFLKESYKYGINWAMEFAKTMMQQLYKKGLIIESWGKRIICVIQDVGFKYLQANYDTSELREVRDADSIHFYIFKMKWNEESSSWKLELDKKVSTNTEGIRRILAGAPPRKFPTISQFIRNIERKLIQ